MKKTTFVDKKFKLLNKDGSFNRKNECLGVIKEEKIKTKSDYILKELMKFVYDNSDKDILVNINDSVSEINETVKETYGKVIEKYEELLNENKTA